MTDIQLIASDMDGTLLNSEHELSPSFYPILRQLIDKNIRFVAASGRQYFSLLKKLERVKDDVIFIAENGSYVVFRNEEIHIQELAKETINELVEIGRKIPSTYIILCGKHTAYIERADPEFIEHLRIYFERYELVDDLRAIHNDQFLKFTLCDLAGAEHNSYPVLRPLQDSLQVKVSGPIWLDISHKAANKGVALEVLQNKFGIRHEQTMVFGDYFNDLEMLQKAHFSYAMENAHPDVKKCARFLTGSNDNEGVVNVLKELINQLNN